MTWTRGTLFTSPVGVGPTVLVFVGEGTVRFRPRVETERNQLRQLRRPAGARRDRPLRVRPHPPRRLPPRVVPGNAGAGPGGRQAPRRRAADVPRAGRGGLRPRHRAAALAVVADALPSGDALVAFQGKRGVLTYALSQSDAEGITLFDRAPPPADRPLPDGRSRHLVQRGRRAGRGRPASRPQGALQPERCAPGRRGHPAHPPAHGRVDGAAAPGRVAAGRVHPVPPGGRPPVLPRAPPGQPDGVPGPARRPVGEIALTVRFSGAHRPEPRGAGGAPGRGAALRPAPRRGDRRSSPCSSTRTGRRGIRRAQRTITRPRSCGSTCPPGRWRSRAGRSRRPARRAGARCSSTGRSCPESTSPSPSAGSSEVGGGRAPEAARVLGPAHALADARDPRRGARR